MCVLDGMRLGAVKIGVGACVESGVMREKGLLQRQTVVCAFYIADHHHISRTRPQQLSTLELIDVDLHYSKLSLDIILHNAGRSYPTEHRL